MGVAGETGDFGMTSGLGAEPEALRSAFLIGVLASVFEGDFTSSLLVVVGSTSGDVEGSGKKESKNINSCRECQNMYNYILINVFFTHINKYMPSD